VREIQRLSTRSATLHSWKDGISHTRGRNPRSSIRTRVITFNPEKLATLGYTRHKTKTNKTKTQHNIWWTPLCAKKHK